MSHYTVSVIHERGQGVDELLAPYDENKRVEPYVRYSRQEAIDYVRSNFVGYHEKSDDECWEFMANEYEWRVDSDGNIYSTYNPKSKWDWFQIGGRFSGNIPLKNGSWANEAKIKNIDMAAENEDGEVFMSYAVVLPDGSWHAPGEVGWFGFSTESESDYEKWINEFEDRFIKPNMDLILTLVDCHI